MIRSQQDPTIASKTLVEHALARFSTDNLSCMVVRLNRSALLTASKEPQSAIGVEGDTPVSTEQPQERNTNPKRVSEASKIVSDAKKKVEAEGGNLIGVSGSNSGKGHDQAPLSPSHTSSPSPPSEQVDANPAPLSPNANPLAASTATGEIPKLNQPPPPKNLNLNAERKSGEKERGEKELGDVKEENEDVEDGSDSKEVDLKGGEAASPETRKSLSLPYGQDGGKK